MKNKFKVVITTAIITENFAIDHLGVKQGLDQLSDKIDYRIIDPLYYGFNKTLELILDYKPDLVVHYMDNSLTNALPQKIAEKYKCIQVFWEMDYRPIAHNIEQSYDGQWQKWILQMPYLDHIFLSNEGQLEDWKRFFKIDVSFLPHGCYVVNKLTYDKNFHYPCVFIGGVSNGIFQVRKDFIDEIKTLVNVTHINESEKNARNEVWSNMPAIYYSSDVVLDISHFWDCAKYASGRYFYTSGLGGCSITKRFPGCEELYPEEIKIYFDTLEEAVEKIKYYQKHEKERERIKLLAYKYNKKYHNFLIRFNTIFKTLNINL